MHISALWALILFLVMLAVLMAITEWLHRKLKYRAEQSRKFLHVSGGLLCLLLPYFFSDHRWVLALTLTAFVILAFTYRYKMMASVHQTERRSIGSVIFPIPVYVCFLWAQLANNDLFFYLPVSLLTISDTAAEIAGNRWGYSGKQFFNGQKTLAGALTFFITALPLCIICLLHFTEEDTMVAISTSILLATAGSIAELLTLNGWDNLSLPLTINLMLLMIL